jgi:hypothetical protein
MTDVMYAVVPFLTVSAISCFGLAFAIRSERSEDVPPPQRTPSQSGADRGQSNTPPEVRSDVEQQQRRAEAEAEKTLDKRAAAAIEETRKAVQAIAANNVDEARAAIESATEKTNLLLSQNSVTAAIPSNVEVQVFDLAPGDPSSIMDIAKDVSLAVDNKDFPTARVLLHSLMSEVRIRSYNLPLATFPFALKEATRLLDQKKMREANAVLLTALHTLVVIDRVSSIPLLLAREDISKAQKETDKVKARMLLEQARTQIQRSRNLGYAGKDPMYVALSDQIDDLEKRLKGGGELGEFYNRLKERISNFLKEHSEQPHH